jgi:hypothetical protein
MSCITPGNTALQVQFFIETGYLFVGNRVRLILYYEIAEPIRAMHPAKRV